MAGVEGSRSSRAGPVRASQRLELQGPISQRRPIAPVLFLVDGFGIRASGFFVLPHFPRGHKHRGRQRSAKRGKREIQNREAHRKQHPTDALPKTHRHRSAGSRRTGCHRRRSRRDARSTSTQGKMKVRSGTKRKRYCTHTDVVASNPRAPGVWTPDAFFSARAGYCDWTPARTPGHPVTSPLNNQRARAVKPAKPIPTLRGASRLMICACAPT